MGSRRTHPVCHRTMPSLKILSLNASGLQAPNRLDQCISSLSSVKPDVVLLQEHGLHSSDSSVDCLAKSAKRYGYLAAAAFIPTTKTKGGTAVLIKWSSFGLLPSSKLQFETALGVRRPQGRILSLFFSHALMLLPSPATPMAQVQEKLAFVQLDHRCTRCAKRPEWSTFTYIDISTFT